MTKFIEFTEGDFDNKEQYQYYLDNRLRPSYQPALPCCKHGLPACGFSNGGKIKHPLRCHVCSEGQFPDDNPFFIAVYY